jgi:hypothetical protein
MVEKTGPLPIPQFGGAALAGAKPMAPTVPLIKAEKQFNPKSPKRKHAFHKGETAYSGSSKSKNAFPG